MNRRGDAPLLITGLLFLLVAVLGIHSAVGGPLDPRSLWTALPVCLIAIGLVSLFTTRHR